MIKYGNALLAMALGLLVSGQAFADVYNYTAEYSSGTSTTNITGTITVSGSTVTELTVNTVPSELYLTETSFSFSSFEYNNIDFESPTSITGDLTTAGTDYQFAFYSSINTIVIVDMNPIHFTAPSQIPYGVAGCTIDPFCPGLPPMPLYSTQYTPVTFTLASGSPGGTSVPEPGSVLLLGSAIAGLAARRRRRG